MLINQRSGCILAQQVTHRRTPWERSLGLIFRQKIDRDEALVFYLPRAGIREAGVHTLFVPFPFGLLWLDEGCRVLDKAVARPWKTGYRPAAPARYIVEMHPSRLRLVQRGDRLQW